MALSQVAGWVVYLLVFHRTPVGYLVMILSTSISFYLVTPFLGNSDLQAIVPVAHFLSNAIPAIV